MCVKVKRIETSGRSQVEDTVTAATGFVVDDGSHLLLQKEHQGHRQSVAAYAPSEWASVHVQVEDASR